MKNFPHLALCAGPDPVAKGKEHLLLTGILQEKITIGLHVDVWVDRFLFQKGKDK
jgi:hypothetical protein